MQLLGGLSAADFLRDYWQQRPLQVRGAWPGLQDPLSPEELAGLACEDGVEARLVLERDGPRPWTVRHAPFTDADFLQLPATHWTLLVQDAEKQAPDRLADFLETFRFIPDWRIDDLMISYAPAEGSVGPHTDDYDVFLLQGRGRRRWRIDSRPPETEEYLPDTELRILQQFTPDREWVLECGDLLYLPPRIPHHGIALEPCITYSIGFRAPSVQELVNGYLEFLAEHLDPRLRYTDPGLALQDHPGALTATALARVRELLYRHLYLDDATFASWFGRFISEPKPQFAAQPEEEPYTVSELQAHWRGGGALERNPGSRFAFLEQDGQTTLFVDGQEFVLGPAAAWLAALLCRQRRLRGEMLRPAFQQEAARSLLLDLVNEGYLVIYADDDDA